MSQLPDSLDESQPTLAGELRVENEQIVALIALDFVQRRRTVPTYVNYPSFQFQKLFDGQENQIVVLDVKNPNLLQTLPPAFAQGGFFRKSARATNVDLNPRFAWHGWQLPFLSSE